VFWGEVDLNGQVRPVFSQAIRMRQAERLAYNPVFHPRSNASHTGGWTRVVDVCGFCFPE
jgi:DNA repair protein RadA/Sms